MSQVGSSTALAGLKLEVFVPRDNAPGAGAVQTTVELTPLCSPDVRPGRPSETSQARGTFLRDKRGLIQYIQHESL